MAAMAAIAAIAADVGIGLLLFTCSSVYPLLLTPDGQADRIGYVVYLSSLYVRMGKCKVRYL